MVGLCCERLREDEWWTKRADQLLAERALDVATPRRAGRDGVAWSPGRVAASDSLNSLSHLGWANQTVEDAAKMQTLALKAA